MQVSICCLLDHVPCDSLAESIVEQARTLRRSFVCGEENVWYFVGSMAKANNVCTEGKVMTSVYGDLLAAETDSMRR